MRYTPIKKTEEELKKITDHLIKLLLDVSDLKIEKIILYGSYARGEANDESDIDILVLCDDREEKLDKKRSSVNRIGSRISLENDIDVAVRIKDKNQFEKWVNVVPFYQSVDREGVVLYEK